MRHSSVQYCPIPVALPIIFVPGLMGSRLRVKRDKRIVWDPEDSIGNAVDLAKSNAAKKRANLIGPNGAAFNPDYLEVDPGEDRQSTFLQQRVDRGWGGLLQGSYSGFLAWLDLLAEHPTDNHLPKRCSKLHFEVWAHPYNWTDDNLVAGKALADTVRKARDGTAEKYQGTDVRVLKPILITHSMGGLVSRAYTQLHGGEGEVHGVIHGAQPCDGSPTAYKRILAGFEGGGFRATGLRLALGANQQQVTATAANMPGVLQLLPNQWHKTVNGAKEWLHGTGRDGSWLWSKPNANPYAEIYLNQSDWWRLIHAEYLNPGGDYEDLSFASYTRQLRKAEALHAQLGPEVFHPNTCMFYSSDSNYLAWDQVEWKQTEEDDIPPSGTVQETNGRGRFEWRRVMNATDPYHVIYSGGTVPATAYELQPPRAPGDGTVHAGSGIHVSGPMSIPLTRGFEHQPAFDSVEARQLIAEWVFDMVEEQM